MIPKNFQYLCDLLYQRSGLVLSDNKAYLVESRLMPFVRQKNMESLDDFVEIIQRDKDESLLREITDAMTTNESFFFRDGKPFKIFQESILPALIENRSGTKKIRIWSAAAATGQEPYTLAMLLKEEEAKLGKREIEIIGTDISDESLKRAREGLYTQFEVQRGLPIQLLVKYFSQESNNQWRVNEDIRKMVSLRHMNLLGDLSILGTFDIVFCRNVLIYFDQPTKIQVLEKISKRMERDGVLFLGGAETVLGISDSFKPMSGARGAYGMGGSDGVVGMVAALSSVPATQQSASHA